MLVITEIIDTDYSHTANPLSTGTSSVTTCHVQLMTLRLSRSLKVTEFDTN